RRRPTPIGFDQAHRNLERLMELAAEVILYSRESRYRGWGHELPGRLYVLGGLVGYRALDMKNVDRGVICLGDLFLFIVGTLHRKLHVGLPGAQPNLAYQHV